MGTPCAVAFANLYLLRHNQKVMELYDTTLNFRYKLLNIHKPILFRRFIDDILCAFNDRIHASHYVKCFNRICSTIQIPELLISDKEVNFLDMSIYIKENVNIDNEHMYSIFTKLYSKPCNKYIYLPPCSFHLPHIFQNWVKNEFSRIRILCKENVFFHQEVEKTKTKLIKRGYSETKLTEQINNIPDRLTLIHSRKQNKIRKQNSSQQKPVVFISTHTPASKAIVTQSLLTPTEYVKFEEFKDRYEIPKPLITFRNQPNFGKLLTVNTFCD